MKKIILLTVLLITGFNYAQTIVINELDADQTATDTEEFIELKSQNPNQSLDGYIVVLYNGSNDSSYNTVDLTGYSTDANGFFIIGSDAVAGVDIPLGANNTIQNGADAVAIYQDSAANFPNGTLVTNTNLVDALVYGTSDPDDAELIAGLGVSAQYDENLNGNKDTESLQRRPDGTFCTNTPTLRAVNACPACTFVITDINTACDNETGGTDTVTITLDYTGGGTETYNLAITSGSGTIGGDDPTSVADGTIIITNVTESTSITFEVTSANCNVVENITTPACVPATQVANIAALRAGNIGETYILTGEAVVTFTQTFRNQKFIEDNTAAILIDDNDGIITTTYAIGDGITGLQGTLGEYNGQMQFIPVQDAGTPSSTGNTVTPQVVSITDLNANTESYESEYVQIASDVTIDTSANTTWVVGTVYPMTNANGSFNFRTSFYDANYIGEDVPTSPVTIAGIITERNNDGGYYITARDNNDAATVLGIEDNTLINVSLVPNPASQSFKIVTAVNGSKIVTIYNLLGKQVLQVSTNDMVDISKLAGGVYIVKITQGTASSTQKLVVR